MNVKKLTIDTNILVYAFDIDAGKKHRLAIQVIERAMTQDCVLTLQALSEFFNTLNRKSLALSQYALEIVSNLQELFPIVFAKQTTLQQAMNAVTSYKLSFWDAMILATAKETGVDILLSEDFQHEQLIEGVRIINPFIENKIWTVCAE